MRVLGIETSCDDTSAAVVSDGRILSNVVSSQIVFHRPFRGVVPELASRRHLTNIVPVVERALSVAGRGRLDAVAYTRGPGLMGPLLVGKVAALTLAGYVFLVVREARSATESLSSDDDGRIEIRSLSPKAG